MLCESSSLSQKWPAPDIDSVLISDGGFGTVAKAQGTGNMIGSKGVARTRSGLGNLLFVAYRMSGVAASPLNGWPDYCGVPASS